MKLLIDTNVATRNLNTLDAQHAMVASLLRQLAADGHVLCISSQVLYETWVVFTRPVAVNGLGYSSAEANRALNELRIAFTLITDPPTLLDDWQALCVSRDIRGKRAHDARFIALIRRTGLDGLVTLNERDFAAFGDIARIVVPTTR